MSDVTFGVKVTEEMKNELSELMKTSDLNGKEFMHLLLTTYKIEQTKRKDILFESDISELQILLQRIQSIYLNVNEKSKILLAQSTKQCEEDNKIQEEEKKLLKDQLLETETQLNAKQLECTEYSEKLKALQEENKRISEEAEENKNQAKNYFLLHTKFEQEIKQLESKIEDFKRLEYEIEERNKENTALKNRNDELASELWFLKREVEKLNDEKSQHILTSELQLKNNLLEQKLVFTEKIELLKEENMNLQREFSAKLQKLYENAPAKE
jgi:hypothetical protein